MKLITSIEQVKVTIEGTEYEVIDGSPDLWIKATDDTETDGLVLEGGMIELEDRARESILRGDWDGDGWNPYDECNEYTLNEMMIELCPTFVTDNFKHFKLGIA